MNYLLVFLGGGLGAMLRFGISHLIQRWNTSNFPWSTLLVNILASLLLGFILIAFKNKTEIYLFGAIGICGGFSTFSTFAKENLELIEQNNWILFALNLIVSTVLCVLAVYIGKKFA